MKCGRIAGLLLLLQFSTTPAVCKTLEATIEHAEALPAVPPSLRMGAEFNEQNLPRKRLRSVWYQIPAWKAGTWQRTEHTERIGFRKVTFKDISSPTPCGYQTDLDGGIWHWIRIPSRGMTTTDSGVNYFLNEALVPLKVSQEEVITRGFWKCWQVDRSGFIRSVRQGEQIDSTKPIQPGVNETHSSVAYFDELGNPTYKAKATWIDRLIEPYRPIDRYEDIDVKQLFADFLMTKDLRNPIPEQQKP